MSDPIGPGDWVECVKVPVGADGYLALNALYLVEQVWFAIPHATTRELGDCLDLVDVPRGPDNCAWNVGNFRPIYRPKADLIQSLLKPVKEGIDA